MKSLIAVALLSIFSALSAAQRPETAPPPSILSPCEVNGAARGKKEQALCGTLNVYEDRARRAGRKIPIKIVVFPATGNVKAPDPVVFIPGGPGSSATNEAPFVVQEFAKVRESRDMVFIDLRGTGGSNSLDCVLFDREDPQSYLGHWNPPDRVRECRKQLEKVADLRLYTTPLAMDDLEEVRAALGIKKLNFIGSSYGTRAVQDYLKRYPKNVRSAVLQGLSPTSQFMPRDFPADTERALNGILDECLADKDCRAAFPEIKAETKKVLETLIQGPVEVEVNYPLGSKNTRRVRLSRDLAAEAVRYMLYQSRFAGRVPLYLHLAAGGNYKPLAEAALMFRERIVGSDSTGLYISVTCAEDLPFIKPGEGERKAVGTFLGDYRLRQQREDCALWPTGTVPKNYAEPTRSDVPVLILSGQWDPVTPPSNGDAAAKGLTNSLHVVVPSGGHGFGGLDGVECVTDLMVRFFETAAPRSLDTSCVKSIKRPGFMLKLN
jgi:pimeloyl-ACP methyl ester carboxylesterase